MYNHIINSGYYFALNLVFTICTSKLLNIIIKRYYNSINKIIKCYLHNFFSYFIFSKIHSSVLNGKRRLIFYNNGMAINNISCVIWDKRKNFISSRIKQIHIFPLKEIPFRTYEYDPRYLLVEFMRRGRIEN